MSTDHPQRTDGGKLNPDAWITPAPRKSWIKRTALAAWLAEYFILRGFTLVAIGLAFGVAGFVACLLGALL